MLPDASDDWTGRALTHTRPLPERHEGAEDAVYQLRPVLDGEASLQLQSPVVVNHPADTKPPLASSCLVSCVSQRQRKKTKQKKNPHCQTESVFEPCRPVQQQLIDAGVDQQRGVSGLSADPRAS